MHFGVSVLDFVPESEDCEHSPSWVSNNVENNSDLRGRVRKIVRNRGEKRLPECVTR
jgi:hypothetical protein